MNTPVIPGAQGDPADMDESDEGLTAFRVGALMSQSEIDKFKITHGTIFGSNYVAQQTDWDGLTKGQEVTQAEQERIQKEAEIEAEWQANLDRYDDMIRDVDARQAQLAQVNKELDGRALHMSNNKLAYKIGPHQYAYIDEHGNETIITDPDEQKEAERLNQENEAKGIQTADGNTKIDVIKQTDALNVQRARLVQERGAAAASGGPHNQQELDAFSAQTTKREAETRAILEGKGAQLAASDQISTKPLDTGGAQIAAVPQLSDEQKQAYLKKLDMGDAELAASDQISTEQKIAKINRYDDDDSDAPSVDDNESDAPSVNASMGRTGTVAEQIAASPTPGKGTAVQAFAMNASPPVSAPVVTTTIDTPATKNPAYSNTAPA